MIITTSIIEIVSGATLEIVMGNKSSETWGVKSDM
jgi:hypothetical protein